jgi:hypothetical protein
MTDYNRPFNLPDDYEPPKKVWLDDIIVTDPELGNVPFWRALLWNTAHLRAALTKADSIIDKQRQHEDQTAKPTAPEEQKPPPLAADDAKRVDDALVAKIEKAVDALSQRLDALEAGREAEAALEKLEECVDEEQEQQLLTWPPPKETKH